MLISPWRSHSPRDAAEAVTDLDTAIRRLTENHLRSISALWDSESLCRPAIETLAAVSKVRSVITDLRNLDPPPVEVLWRLEQLVQILEEHKSTLQTCHYSDVSRILVASLEAALHRAIGHVRAFEAARSGTDGCVPKTRPRQVVIPTELLFLAHRSLFPAERMAIVAGRTADDQVQLTVPFDVTGRFADTNWSHVRGDPELLSRALIAMELTGSHFAGWVHSHPGSGPGGTLPSNIDRRQHSDLVRHYSDRLVCVIVVADGHVRFWGDAVESGSIEVQLLGQGVVAVAEEDHVFRLDK